MTRPPLNSDLRPRVLIPSDEPSFVPPWAEAYRSNGCEVAVGTRNFHFQTAQYDLLHILWPEELTGWRPPSADSLSKIARLLDGWQRQSKILVGVNNLHPHGGKKDQRYWQLYQIFYESASAIQHYSSVSVTMVCEEFPAARSRPHVVTGPFNYAHLLRYSCDRATARASLSLRADEFCLLIIGAVRFWAEVRLLMRAVSFTRLPKLRILMAGRWEDWEVPRGWRRRLRRFVWLAWLRKERALRIEQYVPDEELPRLFAAADAVAVLRIRSLNSALPLLAMTLGRLVIAPNWGAIPEFLAGTRNLLYEPGDARSLAEALERAGTLDREAIGAENQALALSWSWKDTAARCLRACGFEAPASASR